jgi:hypothetical protein
MTVQAEGAEVRREALHHEARRTWNRDFLLLVTLGAIEEVLHRTLNGGVVVAALLSPAGAKEAFTLLLGLLFVTLRVVLFVGAPGWAVSQLVLAISRRCLYRG